LEIRSERGHRLAGINAGGATVKRTARLKPRKRLQRGRRLNAQSAKERLEVAPRWRAAKQQVMARAIGRCEVALNAEDFTSLPFLVKCRFRWRSGGWRCIDAPRDVHHVVKQSQGGQDVLENLLAVCRACHEWFDAAHSEARGRLTAVPGEAGATPTCAIQRSDKWASA
jgi:hypothetical protein